MSQRLLVVRHTHWDREWYRTAEQFRVGLVELMDEILGSHEPFLLDGQAIVLDDYLAWKPEQREALCRSLTNGQVECGPWYVLADNLMPSGEALVRNLLVGRAALARLGAAAPPVLYCPDSFGHPAAGPVLAHGFGLTMAIVWRGYGGRGWGNSRDAARWRSTSGAEVHLYHLPPSGYEHAANVPAGAGSENAWRNIAETLRLRAALPTQLVLNGADHHAPQHDFHEALAAGQRVLGREAISVGSLRMFVDRRLNEGATAVLPTVIGELRASPGYAWALQGTLGTRTMFKRSCAQIDRLLLTRVEPMTAHAWWETHADFLSVEQGAWRLALENQPHDTRCGCSIDSVIDEAQSRTERATALATALSERAMLVRLGVDRDMAREAAWDTPRSLALINVVPRRRGGLVECVVDLPLGPVLVGPGSDSAPASIRSVPPWSLGKDGLPVQLLKKERVVVLAESPRHYPRATLVQRVRALAWVDALPPMGIRSVPILERARRAAAPERVTATARELRNGRVTVGFSDSNRIVVRFGERVLDDVLSFEVVGDGGDLYTHSPIRGTFARSTWSSCRVTQKGPLRGELRVQGQVKVPEREITTATEERVVARESVVSLTVLVQLDVCSERVRFCIEGENNASDYRLRAVLKTQCQHATHRADAAFGSVVRNSTRITAELGDVEVVEPTAPLHRCVSLFDDAAGHGVTLIADGLSEYEAMPNGDVALTVLRAVGELSRPRLPERPGHAGWPAATPRAQCMGPFAAHISLLCHGLATSDTMKAIEHACDDELVPLLGVTVLPVGEREISGVSLEGEDLSFLACKRASDGSGVVVRCLNRSSRPAHGVWQLKGIASAYLARLDETPLGALPVRGEAVAFEVPPYGVSTVLLFR